MLERFRHVQLAYLFCVLIFGIITTIIGGFLDFFPSETRQRFPQFLPISLADWIVRRVTKHNYYLQEEDIEIEDWGVEQSPVLIAVCKKSYER